MAPDKGTYPNGPGVCPPPVRGAGRQPDGTPVRLSQGKRRAGGPHGGRWCQPALRLSRLGRSSGEFTLAVIHVTDVRAAVEEMRGRGVEFEEYDTPETRAETGVARMPGGGEAALFHPEENQPLAW
jgi:hypothetical protein